MEFDSFLQRPKVKEYIANMELEKVYDLLAVWKCPLFTSFLKTRGIDAHHYFNTRIPAHAFSSYEIVRPPIKLPESITINASVKKIENNAFYGNKNLKYVRLPAALQHVDIGAFDGCDNIKGFYYPGKIAELNNKFDLGWQNVGDMLFFCADGHCTIGMNGKIKDIHYYE